MATIHRSFRLATETADALDASAATQGLDRTALAQRLIAEGLVREAHPLIGFRDSVAGRVAVLPIAEIEVWQVIAAVKAGAEPLDELGLKEEELRAAIRYYDASQAEIDALLRRDQLVQAHASEQERRDQELLHSLRP